MPVGLPGTVDSPGSRIWSFVKAPALTTMEGLVEEVTLGIDSSFAVKVEDPAVLRVTLSVAVPPTRLVLAGTPA